MKNMGFLPNSKQNVWGGCLKESGFEHCLAEEDWGYSIDCVEMRACEVRRDKNLCSTNASKLRWLLNIFKGSPNA